MKKNHFNTIAITIIALISAFTISACTAEPGSKSWCDSMKDKAKVDWTAEQAGIYTKHCLLGKYKE